MLPFQIESEKDKYRKSFLNFSLEHFYKKKFDQLCICQISKEGQKLGIKYVEQILNSKNLTYKSRLINFYQHILPCEIQQSKLSEQNQQIYLDLIPELITKLHSGSLKGYLKIKRNYKQDTKKNCWKEITRKLKQHNQDIKNYYEQNKLANNKKSFSRLVTEKPITIKQLIDSINNLDLHRFKKPEDYQKIILKYISKHKKMEKRKKKQLEQIQQSKQQQQL